MPSERRQAIEKVTARYAVALPESLADLIDRSDPDDPIARQFVPDAAELGHGAEELVDPIGDDAHSPVEGIVHRYPDRVLQAGPSARSIAALHHRHQDGRPRQACRAVARGAGGCARLHPLAPTVWEVILTAGDRLFIAAAAALDEESLARDRSIKSSVFIRGCRFEPARITANLVRAIKIKGKPTYVAVHVNHPRELTAQARAACARIADAGIPILSQTVLLAGVNDTAGVMDELMRALVECRIKPYYLHHGDLAPGTGHLRTACGRRS